MNMEPLTDAFGLLRRQSGLEEVTCRPGASRVTDERELYQLEHNRQRIPGYGPLGCRFRTDRRCSGNALEAASPFGGEVVMKWLLAGREALDWSGQTGVTSAGLPKVVAQ
jgi:hypothetical protein